MNVDLLPVLPAILVALTGILILLAGAFAQIGLAACRNLATAGLGAALLFTLVAPPTGSMGGTILGGAYSAFLQISVLVIAILAVWLAAARLDDEQWSCLWFRFDPHLWSDYRVAG